MIAVWILAGVALLLLLPVHLRVRFDGEWRMIVRYAGIPVYRYSSAKPAKRRHKGDKSAADSSGPAAKKSLNTLGEKFRQEGAQGLAAFLKDLLRLVTGTARRLFAAVHMRSCRLSAEIGGADSAEVALTYGRVCAAAYPAAAALRACRPFRSLQLTVEPCFLRESTAITADVAAWATPIRLLWVVLCALVAVVKRSIKTTRSKESEVVKNG